MSHSIDLISTGDSILYPRTRVEEAILESKILSVTDFVDEARKTIHFAETSKEKTRRERTHRRRLILWDCWQKLLQTDMENRLTGAVSEVVIGKNGELVDISRNSARDIWQTMAVLYKTHTRRYTDPIQDGEKYNALTKKTKFQTYWQTVEIALQAFNDVVLWPTIINRNGKDALAHRWAAGDSVSVMFDHSNDEEPVSVLLMDKYDNEDGVERTRYHYWTKEWRGLFDQDGKRLDYNTGIKIADDDDNWENPYGELPFVFVHRSPFHPYWWDQTTGEDLIQLTLKIGRRQTMDNYLWKMSGHKQLVVAGEDIPKVESQLMDPGAIIKIRAATPSFQLVDWQVDFKGRQEVVNQEEIRAAASRGINSESLRKTAYMSSGVAELSERGLTEGREKSEGIFRDAEAEYYRKACLVAKSHGLADVPNYEAELEVVFAPIVYPTDPMANLELAKEKASLGVSGIADIILQDHPDWTEERALEYLKSNIEQLSKVQNEKSARNIPSDLANESKSAEDNGALGPMVRDNQPDAGLLPE